MCGGKWKLEEEEEGKGIANKIGGKKNLILNNQRVELILP